MLLEKERDNGFWISLQVPEPREVDADGENLCQLNEVRVLAGHTDIVRVMVKVDENRQVHIRPIHTPGVLLPLSGFRPPSTLMDHHLNPSRISQFRFSFLFLVLFLFGVE